MPKKIGLTTQIFIAMIAGTILGIVIGKTALPLKMVGDVWLNLVKLAIVPIVAAFYRVFDMGITTANCLGDSAGTIVIDRLERRRAGLPLNKPDDDQHDITDIA